MNKINRFLMAVFAMAALTLAQGAGASIVQVGSRAALGANLGIDWNVFPPPHISTPASAAVGAQVVTVSSSQGLLDRHQQGVDFFGNFAPGDQLLSDADSESDSFIVRFDTAVAAAGTQIMRHSALGAFTAYMEFFGADDTLLGVATVNGFGTNAGDGSADFIGGVSDAFDIAYLKFWVDPAIAALAETRSGDLLINRLDVRMPETPVPAPGASAVLLPLLGVLTLRRRRRMARRA